MLLEMTSSLTKDCRVENGLLAEYYYVTTSKYYTIIVKLLEVRFSNYIY